MIIVRDPRPAPATCSASVAQFASLSIRTGTPNRSDILPRKSSPASGMFTDPSTRPLRWSMREGMPNPSAATRSRHRFGAVPSTSDRAAAAIAGARLRPAPQKTNVGTRLHRTIEKLRKACHETA